MSTDSRFDGFDGFDRFGFHPDPRLDRRIPRLYGLLLSIAVLGVVAVTLGLLVLVRLGTG
jgi:hypothetical protein